MTVPINQRGRPARLVVVVVVDSEEWREEEEEEEDGKIPFFFSLERQQDEGDNERVERK